MKYPGEVTETVKALDTLRRQYQTAIQKDHPGDEIEDIKNRIVSYRGYLVKWVNATDKLYAERRRDIETRKTELYNSLFESTEVNKSSRIEHVRYTFKGEDAELDELKALVDAMKRWDKYYQDLVINIQSTLSSIRVEKRVEGTI